MLEAAIVNIRLGGQKLIYVTADEKTVFLDHKNVYVSSTCPLIEYDKTDY